MRLNDAEDFLGIRFEKRPSGMGYDTDMHISCVAQPRLVREYGFRDLSRPYPLRFEHSGVWQYSPEAIGQFQAKGNGSDWDLLVPGIGPALLTFIEEQLLPVTDRFMAPGVLLSEMKSVSSNFPGRMYRDDLGLAFCAANNDDWLTAYTIASGHFERAPLSEAAAWLRDWIFENTDWRPGPK